MEDIKSYLDNPEVFRINRMDAHSDHNYYETRESADENHQTLHYNLNGMWKFKWSRNLEERPIDFYQVDCKIDDFQDIPVPSHIEMNGYDTIHYTNTPYPWDGVCSLRPPHVDKEYNPVGSYVRFFDLPESFLGKEVSISMQGVEQAFRIFLNGTFIGYGEDTFTPSEFNLTEYVKETNNRLCVEVYKKSSAAWLEDQDFFRFSGIFRDVILCAKPKIHVEDLWIKPVVLEELTQGELTVWVKMKEHPIIKMEVYNEKGELLLEDMPSFSKHVEEKVEMAENDIEYYVSKSYSLPSITLWNLRAPYLYKMVLTVLDQEHQVSEVVVQTFGFRHFEIRNKVMYLNGERLIINGVNRHEWNARKGRAITEEDMRADIEVLKRNNISAVRTCHYPNQSMWYELCDENGIIVMDETNLESHGSWQKMGAVEPSWNIPGSLPEWRNAVVDRAVSMFERDKNHPSILWWSCGNESYAGECILAMANYFRRKDSSRYVHYESCYHIEEYSDCTDVYSRMYPEPQEIEARLQQGMDKPYIVCEYMHNMGNSLGGMESYQELLHKYESYQGGFIWDYMDQAIYHMVNGREVLGYGGDFGDRPTDYNFSGNGIVNADRIEKEAMEEVRYWYSTKLEKENHNKKNEAQKTQYELPTFQVPKGELKVVKGDVNIGVQGKDFQILFSYSEGGIVSLVYHGEEWLYRAPKPTYWRALTENDAANGFARVSGKWNVADLYSYHKNVEVCEDVPDEISVHYTFDTLMGTDTKVVYTVYADGCIKVNATLNGKEELPDLPLFGMQFILNQKVTQYEYIGYSGETYPDRYKGGVFGVHENQVKPFIYLMPQEHGCHCYNYGVSLEGERGNQLHLRMSKVPFHFSVRHHTTQELQSATHQEELPDTGRSVLVMLSKMRGVGGINTWGADVEPAYHVSAKEDIELEFYLSGTRNYKK